VRALTQLVIDERRMMWSWVTIGQLPLGRAHPPAHACGGACAPLRKSS
jgi:hypothetical protein